MGDVNKASDASERVVEIPSGFEMDIDQMALMNLNSALIGIDSLENDLLKATEREDEETARNIERDTKFYCEELRLNAYRMAVVMLVTRFQNWIGMLVKGAQITVTKKRNDPSMLVLQLQALNKKLGDGPVPVHFFDELEEVRNSVIHADLAIEWESAPGKFRRVANRYDSGANVEISDDQLKDATNKMVEQIKWYESQI
jgi:hypothetical protein